MDMHAPDETAERVGVLIADACELVERCAAHRWADDHAWAEAQALRADLLDVAADCGDGAQAEDACGAAAELNDLIAHLQALPPHDVALTG